MNETISVLAINTSVNPISTQLHDVVEVEAETVLLDLLNKMGKNAHLLAKWGSKIYAIHHTAPRGPSKRYYKAAIHYHPLLSMLEKS